MKVCTHGDKNETVHCNQNGRCYDALRIRLMRTNTILPSFVAICELLTLLCSLICVI